MAEQIKLEPDQIDFAIKMMSEWARICEDNNRGTSSADVDHSSLLYRLLSGKKALETPPPLRFSYPCYHLGEGKKVEIHNVRDNEPDLHDVLGEVSIDQNSRWKWDDKESGVLVYVPTGDKYQLSKGPQKSKRRNLETRQMEPFVYEATFLQRIEQSSNA